MKKSLNHGLVLKNVHRVIKFNQKPWLKPYIKVITELRKKTQNDFKNKFFKLIINPVIGKTMESVKKKKKKKKWNHQKRNIRKKKKLFSVRAKLS